MRILTITRLTLAEATRRRLLITGAVVSLAFVAVFVAAFWFLHARAGTPEGALSTFASTFLTVFGLYAVYFLTGLMAVFLASGALSGDADSGVLHALLARPLGRGQYVLGRWGGLAALVTVYTTIMAGTLLTASWAFADYLALDALAAVALIVLQALVLLSLALLGSALLPTVANAVALLALFGLAWFAGIIGNVGRSIDNDALVTLATAISIAVPSDAVWRAASYYAQSPLLLSAGELPGIPFASAAPPSAALMAWGVAYPAVAVVLAAALFARRDL